MGLSYFIKYSYQLHNVTLRENEGATQFSGKKTDTVKRSDAVTTGYSNTYGLCGLFCCVGSKVTGAICGVVQHSIQATYTVWTLC
jgi:hypothetical protein